MNAHLRVVRRRELPLEVDGALLAAGLDLPSPAGGIVLVAHGSGRRHASPRNAAVAGKLYQAGLATVLADLRTGEEALEDAASAGYASTSRA